MHCRSVLLYPSGPLNKSVPPLKPPKAIANVLKAKDGASIPWHVGCGSFTCGTPKP